MEKSVIKNIVLFRKKHDFVIHRRYYIVEPEAHRQVAAQRTGTAGPLKTATALPVRRFCRQDADEKTLNHKKKER